VLEPAGDMRARIMEIARELSVLHGFEGFSFGDIAEAVPTTRANIHHHYGTKQRLMDELIDGFVADAEVPELHLLPDPSALEKTLTVLHGMFVDGSLPRSFATMSNDDQVT